MNHYVLIGFMGGLLAFPHCMGMCGGFIFHLSGTENRLSSFIAQCAWFLGKTTTYMFAGALAGYAGASGEALLQQTALQNGISYLAGAVITLAGLAVLGLLPAKAATGNGTGLFTSLCGPLLTSPSPAGALALGMVTGLLPCPIVIGFLAYAMQSGSVTIGMTTMAALGLGTVLPLMLLGGASLAAGPALKKWGASAGGIILIILGLTTVLRGTELFHHLLGCPSQPIFQQPATTGSGGCCAGKTHGGN